MKYFGVVPFEVIRGQCDDLSGARNGGINGPPPLHYGAREEAEEEDHWYRVGVFGTAQRNILKCPFNRKTRLK